MTPSLLRWVRRSVLELIQDLLYIFADYGYYFSSQESV